MAKFDPKNTSRYWRASDMPGVGMLHADFTTHEYAPHAHDGFVIAVTEAGGSEFRSRGRTDIAHRQALLVFNPDEPHSGRMDGSPRWRYRSFYLTEPGIRSLMTNLGIDRPRYFDTNVLRDPELIASFFRLHCALDERADPCESSRRHELFVENFGILFQSHARQGERVAPAPADGSVIAPVLELLRDAFAERITLEQMAAVADLTLFQLIGVFKRIIGLTPHMYLTQLRIRAAIHYLDAGWPLVEAAAVSGFYDQSAFNRHFKRAFGMTPSQYVRARSR
jgi:AraC-like DNA-binding protein